MSFQLFLRRHYSMSQKLFAGWRRSDQCIDRLLSCHARNLQAIYRENVWINFDSSSGWVTQLWLVTTLWSDNQHWLDSDSTQLSIFTDWTLTQLYPVRLELNSIISHSSLNTHQPSTTTQKSYFEFGGKIGSVIMNKLTEIHNACKFPLCNIFLMSQDQEITPINRSGICVCHTDLKCNIGEHNVRSNVLFPETSLL